MACMHAWMDTFGFCSYLVLESCWSELIAASEEEEDGDDDKEDG